jgi:hypothetical protein
MGSSGNDAELSPEVRELIRERITSIEALEVLVSLREVGGRAVTLAELAVNVRLAPAAVNTAVDELQKAGLIALLDGPCVRYQAATLELDRSVTALVDAYAASRVEILVFISQSAIGRVRTSALSTFAEAFKLQGRKK